MADTTSIDDLPTDPAAGNNNNIVLQKSEIPSQPVNTTYSPTIDVSAPDKSPYTGDPKIMNELISGVQRASMTGMTTLPSRDIPRNTQIITNDEQVQPNYVPKPQKDYIQAHDNSLEKIMQQNMKDKNKMDSLESLYEEFQSPIILAMLYFIFQLPVVRKHMMRYLPGFFKQDGNANLSGLVFNSVIFAFIYYVLTRIMKHFEI